MIQAEFQRCQLRLQALRQTYHQAGNEEQLAVAWRLEALLYQVLLEAEEAGPAQRWSACRPFGGTSTSSIPRDRVLPRLPGRF